jgi:hypothetical protein
MAARICALVLLSLMALVSCFSHGVASFGPLRVGEHAPFGAGDPAAHPYKSVPPSRFYIYVVAKGIPTMCVFEECGRDGALVEAMGGWITGDQQVESISMVGLSESKVLDGTQSMVVVADGSGRIVGIYPNHPVDDLRSVLLRHPEFGEIPRQ